MAVTRGKISAFLVVLLVAQVSSGEQNYAYGNYNEPGRLPFRGNIFPNEPVMNNAVPQCSNGYNAQLHPQFNNRLPIAIPENTFNPTNVRPAPTFNTFDNTVPLDCDGTIEIISYESSVQEPPIEDHSPKSRIEIPEATRSILLKALIASLSNLKNKNSSTPVSEPCTSSVYIEEVSLPTTSSPVPVTVSGPVSFIPITPHYSPCPEEISVLTNGSPAPVTVSGPVSFIPITPNYSPCPEEISVLTNGSPAPVTVSGPVSFIPITPNYSPCPEEEYFSGPYTLPCENTPLTFIPEVSTQEVVPFVDVETLPSVTPGVYEYEEIAFYPNPVSPNGYYTIPPGSSADIMAIGVTSAPVYFKESYGLTNNAGIGLTNNEGITIADSKASSTTSGSMLYGPCFHPGGTFSEHSYNPSPSVYNSTHTMPVVQTVAYGRPHVSHGMSITQNETFSGNTSFPLFLNGSTPQSPITIMEIVSCTAHVVSYGTAVTIGPPGCCVSINPLAQNESTNTYPTSPTYTIVETTNIPETCDNIPEINNNAPETYTYIPETYTTIPETDSYFHNTQPNPEYSPCPCSYYN